MIKEASRLAHAVLSMEMGHNEFVHPNLYPCFSTFVQGSHAFRHKFKGQQLLVHFVLV